MFKGIISLFSIFAALCIYAIELDLDDQIDEGEKYYVELEKNSRSYGECWKASMSNLHSSCKQLTEEVQSRLALAFSNCFLKQAGIDPCICTDDVLISDCLKYCTDRVFNTYTEFFTHTQSVCHYLQHREWQIETARTALLLNENSQKINRKLDESARSQSKILDLQRIAMVEQKKSLSNGKILNAELLRSRENARNLYNELKTTTSEQKLLLFEIFDRMKNLQNFVLGEFTGVYTIGYYLVIATLVYIFTSVPRTAEARIWLILIISLNAISEKFVTSYTLLGNSIEVNPIITSELLYERIWLCRKTACLICVTTLITSYYRYKDYNVINNELLREIQRQNMELQSFVKGLTFCDSFSPTLKASTEQSLLFDDRKIVMNNCSPQSSKVIPKRKSVIVKKNTKHQDNTTRIVLIDETILSNFESPSSPSGRRYNLRSSSKLNSPVSPP